MNELENAHWRGGVDAKLDALLAQTAGMAQSKDEAHRLLHEKIERVDADSKDRNDKVAERTDALESRWDRALGAAAGIGIGAGAVGGGVGALVSSLLT